MSIELIAIILLGVGIVASTCRVATIMKYGQRNELAIAVSGLVGLVLFEAAISWSYVTRTISSASTSRSQVVLYIASFVVILYCIWIWLKRAKYHLKSFQDDSDKAVNKAEAASSSLARPKAVLGSLFVLSMVCFLLANCVKSALWVVCLCDGTLLLLSLLLLANTLPKLINRIKSRLL